MERISERKIVLVTRKTRLEELKERYNTVAQARFYVETLGGDFEDYEREDQVYNAALGRMVKTLSALGRVQVIERTFVPNFLFGPEDTVVVAGQDGLVANTLKYLDHQPVVAVNPDPSRWEGVLLPFTENDLSRIVREVFAGKRPFKEISMAMVCLPGHMRLYAVNDLFIGTQSHGSARYILDSGGQRETQSSSGVIVSTGLGSTGWLRSVLTGAVGIARRSWALGLTGPEPGALNGDEDSPQQLVASGFDWSAEYLYYSVREPFPSKTTGAGLTFGRVDAGQPLTITSLMSSRGVIFSDGMEEDFLEFNSGQKASISLADKRGSLVL